MLTRALRVCECSRVVVGCRSSTSDATKVAPKNLIRSAMTPKVYVSSKVLADELIRNCIFHKPGEFLILNKPLGVSTFGYKQSSGGIFETSRYDKKEEEKIGVDKEQMPQVPTIESTIPYLRHTFREPWMELSTGLKRYLSGPIVIPCSPKSAGYLKESIRFGTSLSDNEKHPFSHHRALAICVNKPKLLNEIVRGYATFQTVGDRSEYIFVEGKAKRRAKSGKFAVSGTVEYKMLHSKYGCSLVDLKFGKFSRHFPRLVMSHLMAPILGDKIYLNRLVSVEDRIHTVEPKFTKRNKHRQYVPSELLGRIDMTMPEYMSKIPMFFHVYQTVYPRYGNPKNKKIPDLIAMSQPPEHFSAMLNVLGLTDAAAQHLSELTPVDDFEGEDAVTSKEERL